MSQTIAACLSLHQPTTPDKLPWKIEAPARSQRSV
jgi:hypothetical protein